MQKEILKRFGMAYYLHTKLAQDAVEAQEAIEYLQEKNVLPKLAFTYRERKAANNIKTEDELKDFTKRMYDKYYHPDGTQKKPIFAEMLKGGVTGTITGATAAGLVRGTRKDTMLGAVQGALAGSLTNGLASLY